MNISFHYYAVKTIARYAGFNEYEAQIIAEYSQFVDDFSWTETISVSWAPKEAIDKKLAILDGKKRYQVEFITTGFVHTLETIKLILPYKQDIILTPFHFIPPQKSTVNAAVVPAVITNKEDNQLINIMLREVKNNLLKDFNLRGLIQLGVLLHIFADTYAHQRFCGHRDTTINNFEIKQVIHQYSNQKKDETTAYRGNFPGGFAILPALGHTTVGHAPDDTYIWFEMKHRNRTEIYERNNMVTFLTAAEQIYSFLCSINKVEPKFSNLKEIITRGFYADNYNTDTLDKEWTAACKSSKNMPVVSFNYKRNKIMDRFFVNNNPFKLMTEQSSKSMKESVSEVDEATQPALEGIPPAKNRAVKNVEVCQEFYDFTLVAAEVRLRVAGKYK